MWNAASHLADIDADSTNIILVNLEGIEQSICWLINHISITMTYFEHILLYMYIQKI